MFHKPVNLTEFILQEEEKYKDATGSLTLLLTQIEYASKIIASHIRQAGLVDILGLTGERNTFQEEVKKIDAFSNALLVETLRISGQVATIASEELAEPIELRKSAPYIVFIDPLDGTSNTDISAPLGTIFSIYKNTGSLLQRGVDQVAAGYVLYGSSTVFVYTAGLGVNGFTLDPAIGSFLLSHPKITLPSFGNYYSINEGYYNLWDTSIKSFLTFLKQKKSPPRLRVAGCLVAEIHRTLLKGGIFLYPSDKKQPQGKLRLMYEINPLSFVIKKAGGVSLSGNVDPLSLLPTSVHQRVPIVTGSKDNLKEYQEIYDIH